MNSNLSSKVVSGACLANDRYMALWRLDHDHDKFEGDFHHPGLLAQDLLAVMNVEVSKQLGECISSTDGRGSPEVDPAFCN